MRQLTRRSFITAPALIAVGQLSNTAYGSDRAKPPACGAMPNPTFHVPGEPFYKPGSPARQVLWDSSVKGEHLILSGRVLNAACEPLAGARLDFYQTDITGTYDKEGYHLRGHQFTDADGRYFLDTILPRYYSWAPHIHVHVEARNKPKLTTAIAFPRPWDREGENPFSGFSMAATVTRKDEVLLGAYDFVLI